MIISFTLLRLSFAWFSGLIQNVSYLLNNVSDRNVIFCSCMWNLLSTLFSRCSQIHTKEFAFRADRIHIQSVVHIAHSAEKESKWNNEKKRITATTATARNRRNIKHEASITRITEMNRNTQRKRRRGIKANCSKWHIKHTDIVLPRGKNEGTVLRSHCTWYTRLALCTVRSELRAIAWSSGMLWCVVCLLVCVDCGENIVIISL